MQIISKNIKLKVLTLSQVNQNYLNWFKDKKVKEYIQYSPKNLKDLKSSVREHLKEKNSFFFGIFYKSNHVGNLKIHDINYQKFTASLGILIGEKKLRKKGIGKQVINLIKKWLLDRNIYLLNLGVHKSNIPAIRLYESCNFRIVKKNKDFYKMQCPIFHHKLVMGTAQFRSSYGVTNKNKTLMKSNEIKKILTFLDKNTDIYQIDTAINYNLAQKDIKYIKKNCSLNNKIHTLDNISHKNLKKFFKKDKKKSTNIVFIHDGNNILSKQGTKLFLKLKKLKKEKFIKKIGISIHNYNNLNKILKRFSIDAIQLPYSFVDRRAEKFLKKIKKKNIEIHARSIFLQGSLFSKIKTNTKLSVLFDKFHYISQKQHLKKIMFALVYVLKNKYIDRIIFGVRNFKEFKQLSMMNNFDCKLSKLDKLKSNDLDIIDPLNWPELILEKKKKF